MLKKLNLKNSKLSINKKVGILTFCRNDIRNALTGSYLIDDIIETIDLINKSNIISVLIITGEGKAFSSGGNVKEMLKKNTSFSGPVEEVEKKYRYGIQRIPLCMEKIEIPTIAAINGPAVGAGFDLACMCDFRIMSNTAFLSESFIDLGIIPGDGGAYFLQRLIDYQKAAELTLTGRKVFAEEALKIGLILKSVEADQLIMEAKKLAYEIAKKPKNTIRYTKRLLKMGSQLPLKEFLDFCALFQGISHNHDEHKNALKKLKFKK
jgi:enoyl-CoA hydratase/carnithine racemase